MTGAPGRNDCDYCGAKTGHYLGCPRRSLVLSSPLDPPGLIPDPQTMADQPPSAPPADLGGRRFLTGVIEAGDTVRWSPPSGNRRYRTGRVQFISGSVARIERSEISASGKRHVHYSMVPLSQLTREDAP